MLPEKFSKLAQKEEQRLGLPPGLRFASPFPFAGMNTEDSRIAIDDSEFYFRENFIRIGNGNLRTLRDNSDSIYTPSGSLTIVYFSFYNIGATNYVAAFLSDGTAVQVNTITGATTTISSVPGTFYNGSQLPATGSWGSQYFLISNNFTTNCYFVWDGSTLFKAGGLGPSVTITNSGSGYTSAPTVTAFGGSGTGATFTATVTNGVVTFIKVTNPGTGYEPGENVQLIFSGGGSDTSARLTAVLSRSTIDSISLINGGSAYVLPVVSFVNSGGHASATASLTTGAVSSITVNTGGVNYTSAPTVVISGGGGTGATAHAVLTLDAVSSIVVDTGGSGYSSPPTISFYGGGQTAATATQTSGVINGISVTAAGSGFTSTPTVVITDSAGSGASAVAILSPGDVASVTVVNGGTGYNSAPAITFVGGGGSGATAVANVAAGVITSVTMTSNGTGYTSVPTVVVQGGVNNSAAATATLMPFGVSGSSLETFQQRVWLGYPHQVTNQVNGGTILVSAPGSYTDFATSSGGLIFTSSDSFLIAQYTNLRQSNGYLYPIGDSSVSVISNVQTSGSPSTTTFSYQNTDPQIGTSWRDSCSDFSRTILFANVLGVYGLYGGAVQKISDKMDGIFNNAIFPPNSGALTPSSAVANIYNQKAYFLLMTITDPFTLLKRNVMLGWDEKEWFIASQTTNLTFINTQEVNSNLTAWGTDGVSLRKLFTDPSISLSKQLSTKLYGSSSAIIQKMAYVFYIQAQDKSVDNEGIDLSVSIDNEFSTYPLETDVSFPATYPKIPTFSCTTGDIYGLNLGITISSVSRDFVIQQMGMGYIEQTAVLGSSGTIEA